MIYNPLGENTLTRLLAVKTSTFAMLVDWVDDDATCVTDREFSGWVKQIINTIYHLSKSYGSSNQKLGVSIREFICRYFEIELQRH